MGSDRRWRVGIAASLLLNVFLVGLVVGHLLSATRQAERRADNALVPAAHVRALPPDQKSRFAAAMRDHRETIREARKGHQEARRVVEADIAAPTFDRDKLNADFAALRRANQAVQEAANAGLVDALEQLSPLSRASIVRHEEPSRRPQP